MGYPSTALLGAAPYPSGYGPGFAGVIPVNNNMLVTSTPEYISPKPSSSVSSNVNV